MSSDKSDKKKITALVGKATFKNFNSAIVEKFGSVHGYLGRSVDEAMNLWIRLERGEIALVSK